MLNLFLLAMSLVPLADNVVTFLLLWELMSVASYFLVLTESDQRETRQAGLWYLAMAHGGLVLLMAAFLLVAASAPSTGFADLRAAAAALPAHARDAVFLLALLGFGSKAGLVPLHVWLPLAHPAAPSHVSALMSGAMIKMGVYGLLRVALDLLGGGPPWWGGRHPGGGRRLRAAGRALRADGARPQAAAGLLLRRERRDHLPRHRRGPDVPELRAARPSRVLGLVAGLYHTLNHACFKGLLFLGAGAVLHATHTRNMEELGGLIKGMPRTALCFLVGRGRHLRAAAAERLRLRVAGVPGAPGRAAAASSRSWRVLMPLAVGDARAHQRAGRRVLREGLRHHVPRHPPLGPRRRRRARCPWPCSSGWARSRCACVALGVLPSLVVPVLGSAVARARRAARRPRDRDAGADARDARQRGRDRARRRGGRARAGVGGRGAWRSGSAPPIGGSAWATPGAAAASARRPGWSTRRPRSRSRCGASSPSSTARPRTSRSTSTRSRGTSSSRSRTGARSHPWFERLLYAPARVVPAPDGLPRALAPGGLAAPLPALHDRSRSCPAASLVSRWPS